MVALRPPGRNGTLVSSRLCFYVLAAVAIPILAANADARTWYIKPDGSGDAPTIQAAIDSATAGDDVLLAPGTYDWTSPGMRFPIAMEAGIWLHSASGPDVTILDAGFEYGGQVSVVSCGDVGSETRIEGLTITRGFGGWGAGISVSGNSAPTIRDCIFVNNRCFGFGGRGGAVFCDQGTIDKCTFVGNGTEIGSGGAIYCGAAIIRDCTFKGNRVGGDGGASGGAVFSNSAVIRNCIFEDNGAGDQISAEAGAVFDAGDPTIEGCMFTRNEARGNTAHAGAVLAFGAGGRISDCLFWGNSAWSNQVEPARGGAVYAPNGISIVRCVLIGNSAGSDGIAGLGGAAYIGAGGDIEQCTLFDNGSRLPGGVGGIFMLGGTVRNLIVSRTSTGSVCGGSPGPTWICNDLFDNSTGNTMCGTDGGGNFSADPQFCAVDPEASLNVTLQVDSPCAPGNHPDSASCGLIGAAAVGCGTVAVGKTTWSRLKSWYR
jgi:parallel beta helix pectate lyase-like protein